MQRLMNLAKSRQTGLYEKVVQLYSQSKFDSSKDYYKVLDCNKSSSDSEIKKSFYKLAKKYHPDVYKGDENKFKEINEAYEVLSDNDLKKQYDNERQYGGQQQYGGRQQQHSNQRNQQNQYYYQQNQYYQQQQGNRQRPNYGQYNQNYSYQGRGFSNQQEFDQYVQQVMRQRAQQQKQQQEYMKQQQYYYQQNQKYQEYGNFNPYEFQNRFKVDPNDPFMKAAHDQWLKQMEAQRREDEEYRRQARQKEEEFIRDVEQKIDKAKTFINNIFGNTINQYKEMNKNIDENVEKWRNYWKKK